MEADSGLLMAVAAKLGRRCLDTLLIHRQIFVTAYSTILAERVNGQLQVMRLPSHGTILSTYHMVKYPVEVAICHHFPM